MQTFCCRKSVLQHPSKEVRGAVVALLDALSQNERSTGEQYLVIVKTSKDRGYRTLSGGPADERQSDEKLLEAFESLIER